jgi:hypothetical protein
LEHKLNQYRHATLDAFHRDEFYIALPPRLKHKVAEKCLEKQINLLQFFLNDYSSNFYATQNVILLIVTQLRYEIFEAHSNILEKNSKSSYVYFIKSNGVLISPVKRGEFDHIKDKEEDRETNA